MIPGTFQMIARKRYQRSKHELFSIQYYYYRIIVANMSIGSIQTRKMLKKKKLQKNTFPTRHHTSKSVENTQRNRALKSRTKSGTFFLKFHFFRLVISSEFAGHALNYNSPVFSWEQNTDSSSFGF